MFFDTQNESDDSFVLVPQGTYRVRVAETEIKPNKAGTGRLAVVGLSILQGEFRDAQLKAFFNIEHPNQTAQRIGRAEFKRFLTACGVTEPLRYENDFHRAAKDKVLYVEVDHESVGDKTFAKPSKYSAQPATAQAPSTFARPQARRDPLDDIPF